MSPQQRSIPKACQNIKKLTMFLSVMRIQTLLKNPAHRLNRKFFLLKNYSPCVSYIQPRVHSAVRTSRFSASAAVRPHISVGVAACNGSVAAPAPVPLQASTTIMVLFKLAASVLRPGCMLYEFFTCSHVNLSSGSRHVINCDKNLCLFFVKIGRQIMMHLFIMV